MELHGHSPKTYIHVSVCDLYIPTIYLHILLLENRWTDHRYIKIRYRLRNVESGRGRAVPFLGIYKSKFLCSVEPST
jgi:hypothetical protein